MARLRLAMSAVFVLATSLAVAAQTASGTLQITAVVQPSIALVFDNNVNAGSPGFCPLGNAGTNNAFLDLGTATLAGDSLPCVAFTKPVGPASYQVASSFDVVVSKSNTASSSYRLGVWVSTVPVANVTWLLNSTTLTTTAQTVQAAAAYGRSTQTLKVQVKNSVPAQAMSETVNFLATAN